jgi:hypothetical protein
MDSLPECLIHDVAPQSSFATYVDVLFDWRPPNTTPEYWRKHLGSMLPDEAYDLIAEEVARRTDAANKNRSR